MFSGLVLYNIIMDNYFKSYRFGEFEPKSK